MNQKSNISIKGFNWVINSVEQSEVSQLVIKFEISEILARLLAGRKVDLNKVENFLSPTIRHSLPDPFHLKDMEKAAEIIANAIIKK